MGGLMSTVKANDLQNASGGIPTVKGQRLIPTAWVNFNGQNTIAIRDSENVSSITDNGAGQYTVNFTTAMANANYLSQGMAGQTTTSMRNVAQPFDASPPTTTSCRYNVTYANSSVVDALVVCISILGGQA